MIDPVTEADIQALVDGRLSHRRAREVEEWIAERPEEARRVTSYRAHAQALRDALAPVAAESLPARLDLRLAYQRHPERRLPRFAAFAAAACLLLTLGGTGGWVLRGLTEPPAAGTALLAQEAASSYAVFASDEARPVEIGGDRRHDIDDWFSRRLSRNITSPDLDAMGLKLVGGRLVPSRRGPAGLYLYAGDRGERIVLFVRPMEVDKNDAMTGRDEEGIKGWTWADDGLGFGVFGTEETERLHRVAREARKHYVPA